MAGPFETFIQNKKLSGMLALGIIAILVFLLGNQPTLYILEEQKLTSAPDFFLEGVKSKSYDSEGLLKEVISAKTANHFLQQQTQLEQPVIETFQNNNRTIASAEKGLIEDSSNIISLSKNALITRVDNNQTVLNMSANDIIYNGEQNTIIGQGNSILTSAQGRTVSDTIEFNTVENTATLSGGVKGHYDIK